MSELTVHGRKALVAVAEWLEAGAPHKVLGNGLEVTTFDMEKVVSVDPACGTSCCIAGALCQFEGLGLKYRKHGGNLEWMGSDGAKSLAGDHLGLRYQQRNELFEPWNHFYGDSESFNSAARGAAVIRHLLETGEVDWNLFDDFGKINPDPPERDDDDDDDDDDSYCSCGCCD